MQTTSQQSESEYYVAKWFKKDLDKAKKAVVEGDQDRIYVITGNEGSGKSNLARQLAHYLDSDFSLKDICFSADEFAERIRYKKRFGAIVFDEAFRGLSSRSTISKANKKLIQLIQECRQRNLFVFIVLPSIFLLEKYVALFRSHALLHTSTYKKDYKKRYYRVYNRKNKRLLYLLGQKLMSYSKPEIKKKHRFYFKCPSTIDIEEYNKKKLEAFRDSEKKVVAEDLYKKRFGKLGATLHFKHKWTYPQINEPLKLDNLELNEDYLGQLCRKSR